MNIKQRLIIAIIFAGHNIFAALPVVEDVAPKKTSLKNTILSSVKNNPTTTVFTPPVFLPKETSPVVSSVVVPSSDVDQPVSKMMPVVQSESIEPKTVELPKAIAKTVFPIDPTLPKIDGDSPVVLPVASKIPTMLNQPKIEPVISENDEPKNMPDDVLHEAAPIAEPVEPKMILPKNNLNVSVQEADDMFVAAKKAIKHIQALPTEEPKEKPIDIEPGVLYQQKNFVGDDIATIAFNFEDASLINLLSYMEVTHDIKFITEDIIVGAKDAKGAPANTAGVAGHKISFRTNRNLTRKESWDLFLTFMNIAGLDVIPMTNARFYRVVPLAKANNEPIPAYIGVDHDLLPDSDMVIRYVYFARNISDLSKVQQLLKTMQGGSAKLDVYAELRGLIFTDRACAIKSLMKIVTELDKAVLPEVVTVIKLKRANVADVIKLYNSLKPAAPAAGQPQKVWAPSKKESTLDYFPTDVALVGDNRTNSLIVLGTTKDVQRIEEFVTKYIDISVDRSSPPIFTYRLQYTNASDILAVVNKIVQYKANSPEGQYGGVRDGIKFFQKMNIVSDSFTNSLIINATPEDFEALKPLIQELDVPQKQVGIEVLIVQVQDADVKTLGAQISGPNGFNSPVSNNPNLPFGPTFAKSITAQTSGIAPGTPIVVTAGQTNQDDFSIKSSLASLLGSNVLNEVGSVLVTFGKPIWAIFKILKTITSTHVIANPFLVVTNNSSATITSGEERRQVSGEVISAQGQRTLGLTPVQANLTVNIRPQINKGNIINLSIDIENTLFAQADASSSTAADGSQRNTKKITTTVTVANGETLALGGIMSESYSTSSTGVPLLEQIPVVGWFFKSKNRKVNRDHFMIFICPRLLDPVNEDGHVDHYSNYKLQEVQQHLDLIDESDWFASGKDPIQRAFFGSNKSPDLQQLHIGRSYDRMQSLDGKIDSLKTKKSNKRKKASTKKKKNEMPPLEIAENVQPVVRPKNAIKQSVSTLKGAV